MGDEESGEECGHPITAMGVAELSPGHSSRCLPENPIPFPCSPLGLCTPIGECRRMG